MSWESIAHAKKAELYDLIPDAWKLQPSAIPPVSQLRNFSEYICQFLDTQELEITNAGSIQILQHVRSGEWTAVEVTRAFCHRAAIAHQFTNCLSEIRFEAAESRARELDDVLFRTGQTIGPLHGLPISLKDRFNVEGLDSACGYVSWLGNTKDADSEGVLVKKLRQLGGVFFVKTNIPMSMLMGETSNNIIGTTVNPYNRLLSPGGATGGEGALLGLKGAPLGWGSDIAGSIRIPCAFNNLYGLRPSQGRLPASGLATSLPGLPIAVSVVGPMAIDLPSLTLATKSVLDSLPWQDDFDVLEMPWQEDRLQHTRNRTCQRGQRNGRLVFGIMKCDGTVMPHPPVLRAIKEVTDALVAQGYEVIEWDPPPHDSAVNILLQIFGSTAGQEVRAAIDASGEPPMPQLLTWYNEEAQESLSSKDLWNLNLQREEYRAAYHKYWTSSRTRTTSRRQVDGVILPVAPSAAVQDGLFTYYAYSAIVNVLDYTAGSFPVTFADKTVDVEVPDYVPLNAMDEKVWSTYDKDVFDGAPVGLQIMGKRLQEEKVVGMMEAIKAALEQYRRSGSEMSKSPY